MLRGCFFGSTAISLVGGLAFGQPHFNAVPEVYTQSPAVFADLFARARCETVNAIILGDSQETSPNGQGSIYIPRLQREFWLRYDNTPATPWTPLGNSTGSVPPADWLVRSSVAPPGVAAARLPMGFLPPNARAIATSTTFGTNVNNDQRYGNLIGLQHDAANVAPGAGIAGLAEYFTRSNQIALDVLAATNPSSGEVRVRVTPAPTAAPSFFQPTIASLTTSMQLEQPGAPELRVQRVGPFTTWNASGYLQVEISGSNSAKLTDVVAVRFVDLADPRGWCITSLSEGGYRASSVLANHANSGPYLAALEPDVAILTYGANESGSDVTPQQYRAGLESLIAFVRGATRADLPIVLIADPYRELPLPVQGANLDRYPGACYEIAQSDPLVLAINSRRVLDGLGWNASGSVAFLSDGVHYTAHGAITKAATDAALLFSLEAPVVDCNANGTPDACDLLAGTSQDADGDRVPDECGCDLDYNRDENADLLDAQLLAQVVAGLIEAQPTWMDGDFNDDENVDLADAQLLARIAAGLEACQ